MPVLMPYSSQGIDLGTILSVMSSLRFFGRARPEGTRPDGRSGAICRQYV